MKKHIAIYLRVSSSQQTTESQEPDLRLLAKSQELPVRWYRDVYTGKTMDRPGWNALWAALEAGKVERIICWRLDRLGRTARGLTALFDELRQRRIGLVSRKEGIDLSTPAGRMMAQVLASVAEYETEVRAQRVKEGQKTARAKGKTWGGRTEGSRNKRTVGKADTVGRLRGAGHTVTQIAKDTGLSRPTIYALLAELKAG